MHDELGRVKEESRRLRELLGRHRIALPAELIPGRLPIKSSAPIVPIFEKLRLFRDLFRGRHSFAVDAAVAHLPPVRS